MRIIYIIVKLLTLPGAMMHAFFEHMTCRVCRILVDDARVIRGDEMLSHVEHELVKRRGASFDVCFIPFLFNLFLGLGFLASGSVAICYLGIYTEVNLWILFYMGVAFLTNLFPQFEDVLMLKENLYKKPTNIVIKVIAAPFFAILYVGSQLERFGLTLITTLLFAYGFPHILGLFVPRIYEIIMAV